MKIEIRERCGGEKKRGKKKKEKKRNMWIKKKKENKIKNKRLKLRNTITIFLQYFHNKF